MKKIVALALCLCIAFAFTACGGDSGSSEEKTEITFADVGWDSIKINNAMAGLVAEHVFGYTWQETPGSTPISHEALLKGEIDVHMEEWTNKIENYAKDLKDGKFVELGVNYDDNHQGFYIPKYIADKYPDLKTVKDLAKHADLFPDPDDKSKGIIYGGVTGWGITEIMKKKVKAYGLDKYYNYVESGSDSVLSGAMTSAWDKKQPIVSYYWEPTWLLGKYDFVLLKDDPYNEKDFQKGIGEAPAVKVTIGVSNDFAKSNPDFCEFLKKYSVKTEYLNEALAHMNDTKDKEKETAVWMLTKAHPELIDEWLDKDQAQKFKDALK